MRKIIEQENTPISVSAGQTSVLSIGFKDYWIVGIRADLVVAKTDSTSSPAAYQDWLSRAVNTISLVDGGRRYISANGPDIRDLTWHMRQRMQGRYRPPDFETGSQTFTWQIPLLFSPEPLAYDDQENELDSRAGIKPSSGLTLLVGWAASSAIGSAITVGAGTQLKLTYLGIKPEAGDAVPAYYPFWFTTSYDPTGPHTALQGLSPIEPGHYYRRSSIVILNGASPNDVRTDGAGGSAISVVGFQTADGRSPVNVLTPAFTRRSQGQFSVADDNSGVPGISGANLAYGAATTKASHNPGVGMIDWTRIAKTSDPNLADPVWGLNLHGKQTTAANLAFTVDTATNTRVRVVHEAYDKY